MNSHFHLHLVIPAGALSIDKNQWKPSKTKKFIFPVLALSPVFRGKYLTSLKRLYQKGKLEFSGQSEEFSFPDNFQRLIKLLFQKKWVVYSKAPFGGPQQVFDYLGRYTHKVAISNERITKIENGKVTFSFKNRKQNFQRELITLEANQFIQRFLLHELPSRFMRIRHFGFLGNVYKQKNLQRIRSLIEDRKPKSTNAPLNNILKKQSTTELFLEITGIDLSLCPKCKQGKLEKILEFGGYKGVPLSEKNVKDWQMEKIRAFASVNSS